jgi:superfamily II DNA or RNA helicase
MAVLFTGAGKTTIGGGLALDFKTELPGRGLWLANRDFLLDQARERLSLITGEYITVEKAGQYMDSSRIAVGSIQTLRGDRLKEHDPDKFAWIIYDECHHAASNGSRAIFEHFRTAKRIGFTATPQRLDGLGLWNAFQSVSYEMGMDRGMQEGYFLEPVAVARYIDSIDISGVGTSGDDLAITGLEEQIAKNAAAIAKCTVEECGDYLTIVYTPGVASAHATAARLNELKPGKAVAVDQNTPRQTRKEILKRFGEGEIQYIVNCAIYVEGLDCPSARAIVIARPTKSESLYKQMAGRGGRPEGWIGQLATARERLFAIEASKKPDFLLLDITGHAGRHSLISAVDALAGKQSPDVLAAVRKAQQAGVRRKLSAIVSEAKQKLADEERESKKRIAEIAALAVIESRRKEFDPFRKLGADESIDNDTPLEWAGDPPTSSDLEWLAKNRIAAKKVTRGTVAKLRAQARKWHDTNMATFRQRKVLTSAGVDPNQTYAMASRFVDAIIKGGFHRKLTPERIAQIQSQREPGEDG